MACLPSRTVLLACATALLAAAAWAVPVPVPKPRPADRLFATCWGWVSDEYQGRRNHPDIPAEGWEFVRPGDGHTLSWPYGGELETTIFDLAIDTTVTPWRLDAITLPPHKLDPSRSVRPGIFRFSGDTLVWVISDKWTDFRKDSRYDNRPTVFTATPKNRYVLYRMKPCRYLRRVGQDVDP